MGKYMDNLWIIYGYECPAIGKTIGKPQGNHRETIGKPIGNPQENCGFSWDFEWELPKLVMTNIAGWWLTQPSENMKLNWDDDIPN